MTSPAKCRSRSWAWTPTTDQNSSMTTCWDGAKNARSPSPVHDRAIRTTVVSRRAEELGGGAHRCRLSPLRHRCRTVATQRDLAVAVQADQLLLPAAETDLQDPRRGQSVQETRHRHHPISSRDRSPHHDRGTHRGANPDLLADQSRRRPTPGPSLTDQLFTLTTSKAAPGATAPLNKRARLREATNPPSRAS